MSRDDPAKAAFYTWISTDSQTKERKPLIQSTNPVSHPYDCNCTDCLTHRNERAMETVCAQLMEIHRLNGLDVNVRHMGRPEFKRKH